MTQINVNVRQVTRIEGHGNIVLKATDGKVDEVRWEVSESPRFFEAMLRGRNWDDVSHIASRICGICAVAHAIASLQATEAAFGIQVSPQTFKLRKLLYHAETLQSHVLHAYFLVAPDFLGVGSVVPLAATHKDVVLRALKLKKMTNDLADALCGRKVHPISCVVGGFSKLPEVSVLESFRDKLVAALPDLEATVQLFATLKVPQFERQTEYISLRDPEEYAFISGGIQSSDAGASPLNSYLGVTNEFCVPHSTAKFTRNKRDSYMVGALARLNNNYGQLSPSAKKVAGRLGLKAPCYNPFMITVAQVVEAIHCAEDTVRLIEEIAREGLRPEDNKVTPKAGHGVGAVEAPRGILFHDYAYDERGNITAANCIIPTNQNNNNIQKDMDALAPTLLNKPEDQIRLSLEMLVRAYDPCVSCSTH